MKKLLLFLAIGASVRFVYAQNNTLALDEHNKYVCYQVKDVPGTLGDSLQIRATRFITRHYRKVSSLNTSKTTVVLKSYFPVTAGAAVTRHEDGEMRYVLTIESRDGKYRFWFTDFVFTPYQRDRYNNFVPVPGINIPLENATTKLEKKQAAACLQQTLDFCKSQTGLIVAAMADNNMPTRKTAPDRVRINKW